VLSTQQHCYRLCRTEGENASSAVRTQTRYPGNVTCPNRARKGLNVNEQKIGILIPQVTHRAVNLGKCGVCTGCPAKTRRHPDTADLRPKSPRSSRGRGTSLPGFLARSWSLPLLTNCRDPRRGVANSALIKTGTFKGYSTCTFGSWTSAPATPLLNTLSKCNITE